MNSTLTPMSHIYNISDYDFHNPLDLDMANNRLFCTFVKIEELDSLISNITSQYSILYNKIFVLNVLENNEYAITYNIDQGNIESILSNTILVHRKKESNTLYTINSLNELVKTLNKGVIDNKFPIDWNNYRNSILLTQQGILTQLKTKIFKIIEV
jgi:hypothetical protein